MNQGMNKRKDTCGSFTGLGKGTLFHDNYHMSDRRSSFPVLCNCIACLSLCGRTFILNAVATFTEEVM
jgi:hypothetical protein